MIELFKAGILLSAAGNLNHFLAEAASGLTGVNVKAKNLQGTLNGLKFAIGGAALASVGIGLSKALWDTTKYGDQYIGQLEQMRLKGMSNLEIAKAEAAARLTSQKVLSSTLVDNLRVAQELRGALLNPDDANKYLPTLQQMAANYAVGRTRAGHETSFAEASEQSFGLVKATEMTKYASNSEAMKRIWDGWFKAEEAFSFKIDNNDLHSIALTSKGVSMNWDEQFITGVLPTLAQEMKRGGGTAGRAGNGLYAMYRNAVGGHMTQKEADEWSRLGLVQDGAIIRAKNGTVKGIKAGGIMNSDLFATNTYEWFQSTLLPALKKKGIDPSNQQAVRTELAGLFGNGTGLQVAEIFATQQAKIKRDQFNEQKAFTSTQAAWELEKDPDQIRKNMAAQWENIKIGVGKALLSPAVVKAMYGFSQGLANIADAIERHPKVTSALVGLAAGLAGFMVVAGGLMLVGGTIAAVSSIIAVGPIIAGVVAFGALIAGVGILGVELWNATKNIKWKAVGDAIYKGVSGVWTSFSKWGADTATKLGSWATGIWASVSGGFGQLLNNVANWFKTLPANIWAHITGHSAAGAPVVPPKPTTVVVHNTTVLDGKTIAKNTTTHVANQMDRPNTGPSKFNHTMSPAPAGAFPY